MIGAEVNLVDATAQATVARILELELTYIQNELKTVSTQVAVIATASFFALMLNEPPSSHQSLNFNTQAVMISAASLTTVFACMTLCSSMFLNMWGANDALRTKNVSMLTDAVSSMRRERILTLRLFTYTLLMFMVTGMCLAWLYFNSSAAFLSTMCFSFGFMGVARMYVRTKSLFKYAPPLFDFGTSKIHSQDLEPRSMLNSSLLSEEDS